MRHQVLYKHESLNKFGNEEPNRVRIVRFATVCALVVGLTAVIGAFLTVAAQAGHGRVEPLNELFV